MRITKIALAVAAIAMFSQAGDIALDTASGYTSNARQANSRALMRSWERSLIPLLASQSLDAASSYGYRELNPMLASSNGTFGMKATAVKFGVVGALVGVEYLLAKKSPRAARL